MERLTTLEVMTLATDIKLETAKVPIIQTPELNESVKAFQRNMERIVSMGRLPLVLFGVAVEMERAFVFACYAVLGKLEFEESDRSRAAEVAAKQQEILSSKTIRLGDATNFKKTQQTVDNLLGDSMVRAGMEGTLSSMLLGIWTAFESLTADLWVVAVNLRPDSLGENVFSDDASLTFAVLREMDYDIKNRLGDIAKKKNVGKFDSLSDLKNAYLQAFKTPFGENNARPSHNLTKIFDGHFKRLQAFELIRNLLAHRGGRIDTRFKERMETCDPELSAITEGSELPMSRELVFRYARPAIACSYELTGFVDNWLSTIKN